MPSRNEGPSGHVPLKEITGEVRSRQHGQQLEAPASITLFSPAAAALLRWLLLQGLLRAVEAEAEALRIIHVRIQKQLQNLEVGASTVHAGGAVNCTTSCDCVVGRQMGSSGSLAGTWHTTRLVSFLSTRPAHGRTGCSGAWRSCCHCCTTTASAVQTEEKLLKHMVNRTRSQRTEQELQQFDLQYPQEQAQRQQRAQQQRAEQQQARRMQKQQQELQGQSGGLSKQQQEEGQQQEGSQLQQLLLQHPLLGQHRQMLGGFRSSSEPAAAPLTQQQQQQPAPEQQQQQQPQQP